MGIHFEILLLLVSHLLCQSPGTPETHPKLVWQKCTSSGCSDQNGAVVIDSEWRDVVDSSGRSCFQQDGAWDSSVCSGAVDCAQKCQLNGFNYSKASVSTSGSAVRLGFLNPDKSIGSRVYLFDETAGQYVNFKMLNKEITFDIDTSTLACGINGALYFSEMLPDGGKSKFANNKAGAEYGTGYCDAQCPRDGKFIGGNANVGKTYGSCCFEWDIWEANAFATQFAGHPCNGSVTGPSIVCDSNCGQCDTAGCAFNHYHHGNENNHDYYGKGLIVDTSKKFTVVTQFVADSGGNLKEVRRKYVQGGKVIENNINTDYWDGSQHVAYDSINDEYCNHVSGDPSYLTRGGDKAVSASFARGAVLAMSIWTDGSMSWLDSGDSGPCEGNPGKDNLIAQNPNAFVEYSNIRYGDIDTTY